MLDFLKSMFGRRETSGSTAKERLKLVLISDHLSLAPDVVQALKIDLIEVISRYLDIDREAADVAFEPRGSEIAMIANIPILGVRDPNRRAAAEPPPLPTTPPPADPALHAESTDETFAEAETQTGTQRDEIGRAEDEDVRALALGGDRGR